jgi:hypothetical protein
MASALKGASQGKALAWRESLQFSGFEFMQSGAVDEPVELLEREDLTARGEQQLFHILAANAEATAAIGLMS